MTHIMTQTSARVALSVLFILALACPVAVAGLVLNFDANTQERADDEWKNSADSGGAVPMSEDKPGLEEGTIDVAGMSFNSKYYTATAPRQSFVNIDNAPTDDIPTVHLENYTMGILVRINGGLLEEEHQMLGIQSDAPEANQTSRIWVSNGDADNPAGNITNVNVMQPAIGLREDYGLADHGLSLGVGTWRWVHISFESGIAIDFYIDGELTGSLPSGVTWDPERPMNIHALFCHSFGERHRTFNGSIANYRVWDEYMTEDQINAEIGAGGGTAVELGDKVTTTWGNLKTQ
ncbi:MAG: hypothetical protein OXN17_21525 [Candidatus Poribacteria bacterium]|nr:hypothetical protein [Candidatus Poribacteria bacterium]